MAELTVDNEPENIPATAKPGNPGIDDILSTIKSGNNWSPLLICPKIEIKASCLIQLLKLKMINPRSSL